MLWVCFKEVVLHMTADMYGKLFDIVKFINNRVEFAVRVAQFYLGENSVFNSASLTTTVCTTFGIMNGCYSATNQHKTVVDKTHLC